jgi:hypothetical protein
VMEGAHKRDDSELHRGDRRGEAPGGLGRFTMGSVPHLRLYGLSMQLEDDSTGSGQAPLRHDCGFWPGQLSPDDGGGNARDAWLRAFRSVRAETERRAAPLSPEDQVVQSMPDASPIKWHRAHTSWFFEQFVLTPHLPSYRVYDSRFAFLFNSYYVAAGPRHARPKRGLMTRPDAAEVTRYRPPTRPVGLFPALPMRCAWTSAPWRGCSNSGCITNSNTRS